MPITRPRATTLTIPIPQQQHTPTPQNSHTAARPPTPRRATYPSYTTPSCKPTHQKLKLKSSDPSSPPPPIPPFSYWEPDTPSPAASTPSPSFSPLPSKDTHHPVPRKHLKTLPSPLLPPPSPTLWSPGLPTTPASALFSHGERRRRREEERRTNQPLSPRFLFPRRAPCVPRLPRADEREKSGISPQGSRGVGRADEDGVERPGEEVKGKGKDGGKGWGKDRSWWVFLEGRRRKEDGGDDDDGGRVRDVVAFVLSSLRMGEVVPGVGLWMRGV